MSARLVKKECARTYNAVTRRLSHHQRNAGQNRGGGGATSFGTWAAETFIYLLALTPN